MNLNKVFLGGNLTRDPEVKFTQSNQAVANLGLAVNRRWRTPEGEQREEVTFIDCEAWGKTAEMLGKFFTKGRPIFIEGRLKYDEWQDKTSGQKRSRLKVTIENFHFVDSKPGGGGGGMAGGGAMNAGGDEESSGGSAGGGGRVVTRNQQQQRPQPAQGDAPHVEEEDIPF